MWGFLFVWYNSQFNRWYTMGFSCFIQKCCLIHYLYYDLFLFYPKPMSYTLFMLWLFPVLSKTYIIYAIYAMAFPCFIQNLYHICYLCYGFFLFYPEMLSYPLLMIWLFPVLSRSPVLYAIYAMTFSCFIQR